MLFIWGRMTLWQRVHQYSKLRADMGENVAPPLDVRLFSLDSYHADAVSTVSIPVRPTDFGFYQTVFPHPIEVIGGGDGWHMLRSNNLEILIDGAYTSDRFNDPRNPPGLFLTRDKLGELDKIQFLSEEEVRQLPPDQFREHAERLKWKAEAVLGKSRFDVVEAADWDLVIENAPKRGVILAWFQIRNPTRMHEIAFRASDAAQFAAAQKLMADIVASYQYVGEKPLPQPLGQEGAESIDPNIDGAKNPTDSLIRIVLPD
jgi:hypothetical protein